MITKKQRKEFTRVVGNRYTARIRAFLEKNNIVNSEGKPYGDSTIRHVFNGSFNNDAIENAFYEVCQEAKNSHVEERVF